MPNHVSINTDRILLNDQPFKVVGLRCSNAMISDETAQGLIDVLDTFTSYGINTISVFLMGSRFGDIKGYLPDATLDPRVSARLGRIIDAADARGIVVLVVCTGVTRGQKSSWLNGHKQKQTQRLRTPSHF